MMKTTRRILLVGIATLSVASLTLAQGPGGFDGPPHGMPPFPVLLALDTDHDGTISAKEIANASAALKKLDKNRDGKLTEDEMRPKFGEPGGRAGGPGGPRPNPAELVSRLMAGDKNKDGKLIKSELPQRMQGMLARADVNKDGILTKAELQKFAQSVGVSSR